MSNKLNDIYEAREQLGGIGRTKLLQLTTDGEITSVKIGRRRFWPQTAIDDYINRLTTTNSNSAA